MTANQVNQDYRRKVMTDPVFRRVVALAERENAKRAKEAKIHREYVQAIKPFIKSETAAAVEANEFPPVTFTRNRKYPWGKLRECTVDKLNGHPVRASEIHAALGGNYWAVRRVLNDLKTSGVACRAGKGWILTKNAKGTGA
jgi:hypothetical protein